MNASSDPAGTLMAHPATALEVDFPIAELSELSEQESWRKEINRPLYHIHKWWATRLGSVFRAMTLGALSQAGTDIWAQFYEPHYFAEKVVLDPFMGSGTTVGEALKLGAKTIGCDINPVSTFMVRQALTPVSEAALREAFARLEATVAPQIQRFYQTSDPETGQLIPVLYYFWCKTVTTPTGEVIPLFSRYVFAQDAYPRKKPRAQIVCPVCWGLIEARYDATSVTCCHCGQPFNPQQGPVEGASVRARTGECYRIRALLPAEDAPPEHRLYAMMALRADGTKVYLPARDGDRALFDEAVTTLYTRPLPLPDMEVRAGHNTNQARGYHYRRWRDFFNARQLLCLGLLLEAILEIEDVAVQEQMLCLFSSTLEFNNLFCSFKGEGTGAVRHMFSNHILKPERTPLENSVWGTVKGSGTFSSLFESRLVQAKRYLDDPFELAIKRDLFGEKRGSYKISAKSPLAVTLVERWEELCTYEQAAMVLNGDSSGLPLPAGSVDAVITDPPYFDFVHYSELSDFFFAWLSPVLGSRYPWMRRPDSSSKGEVQHKDPRHFSTQLGRVFAECHRVLKDEGVLAFTFHHSRAEGWAAIYEAIMHAGFRVVAAHPVHAELRTSTPKSAAKSPISIDAMLVCKKHLAITPTVTERQALERAAAQMAHLEANGYPLSAGDRLVIRGSQLLIPLCQEELDFDRVREKLNTSVFRH